jgi:signal transduction histidine kinase
LAHELRQPLSSIEAIVYYLKLTLPEAGAAVREQLETVRRQVHQAGWLLDDAMRSLRAGGQPGEPCAVNECIETLAAELAMHHERSLQLRLEAGLPPVGMPRAVLRGLLSGLVDLVWDVAAARGPVSIQSSGNPDAVSLHLRAEHLEADAPHIASLLAPPQRRAGHAASGSLRLVESFGGTLAAEACASSLLVEIRMPAAHA